jgi:nucleotide-binding universal stress UspA family protein
MKVLLGFGGTDDAVEALQKTIERVADVGDDLTVALVDDPAADVPREDLEATVRDLLEDADVEAAVRHVEGDAGAALVEIAEAEDFDQIALGGGEKSPMGKIRIGNLQEFVLLNSHKTVTLVR